MKNILTLALMLALMLTLSGCSSIMHELQPHRLWRWNYHEPPGRTDDALFSIDDPLDLHDGPGVSTTVETVGIVDPDHE